MIHKRGIRYGKNCLVTGDTGFLAKHIIPELEKAFPRWNIRGASGSWFFDLTRQFDTERLFGLVKKNHGPIDVVVNLAALSGGIKDNIERPASYYYQNMMINTNVIEECAKQDSGVQKLLLFMGGCSYPNRPGHEEPIKEDEMWLGQPIETSLGYSFAKKANLVGAWSYKQQFGLDVNVLLPTNPIGEWDNIDPQSSHVPMALIAKFLEAKTEGYNTVTVWGSGRPVRDFIYAGDIGRIVPTLIKDYDEIGPINISTGKGTSIAELAEIIMKATGFDGKIHFDRSKPDGQMHKVLDNRQLLDYIGDDFEFTSVEEAINRTVEWYERRIV
jgi:GDP-L-fucose synthase